MPIREQQLASWTKRSSDHEEEKCERAARMIRQALARHSGMEARGYRIIPQGSYHNNTNVRLESDVDLCVVFDDVAATDFTYAGGETFESLRLPRADRKYQQDRDMVEEALRNTFQRNMTPGNKAFDVHSNEGTRVDADVVAAWGFNGYSKQAGVMSVEEGIAFWTRDGRRIVNFPEQHHEKGKGKNIRTGRAYKRATRILKRLRYQMLAEKVGTADGVSSFLLECAMYNVPDWYFAQLTWGQVMDIAIQYMIDEIQAGRAEEWVEVSEKKWLFKPTYSTPSNWQSQQLLDFLVDAAEYLEA